LEFFLYVNNYEPFSSLLVEDSYQPQEIPLYEAKTMTIPEAKTYIGKNIFIEYEDRNGQRRTGTGVLMDVEFVPMYGGMLLFDFGDIRIDKVVAFSENEKAA
jgi:hypothetical protein